ncbi:MAG TPA: biotin--[acetyl-CoA-carboxylase] ligase [Bacteroidota bacterium]|nr:biotin--[acetyl-CoA-carboxylase] ligase [Bacteroidota bacterium]
MREDDIRKHLTTETFGRVIYPFDVLDSTNTRAKEYALARAPEGTLVVADEQTAGRGRMGRSWHSEKGKNLIFSLILRPRISPQMIGMLSLWSSVAITRALSTSFSFPVACKWPNDIQVRRKKCCGILSECIFEGRQLAAAVVGIGLNVNQTEFPDDLRTLATSLAVESGGNVDRCELLGKILREMEEGYANIQSGSFEGILEEWISRSPMMGKPVTVRQQERSIQGIASRLAPDGGLILTTDGKEIKILAGDVKVVA